MPFFLSIWDAAQSSDWLGTMVWLWKLPNMVMCLVIGCKFDQVANAIETHQAALGSDLNTLYIWVKT